MKNIIALIIIMVMIFLKNILFMSMEMKNIMPTYTIITIYG
nr:MAG TPA: hypothetical protein [Caudoviricetes sp.]